MIGEYHGTQRVLSIRESVFFDVATVYTDVVVE